jgi:hypothetical protein
MSNVECLDVTPMTQAKKWKIFPSPFFPPSLRHYPKNDFSVDIKVRNGVFNGIIFTHLLGDFDVAT